MAKNSFLDYSTTASENTDVGGISIAGTAPVSNFDGAFRTMMAQLRSGLDGKVVYAAKSGNYTALAADNNAVLRFTSAATLSLTAAATLAANWHITVVADGGTVTIDPNGSETINGSATLIIPDGMTAQIICDGTGFHGILPASPVVIDRGDLAGLNTKTLLLPAGYTSFRLLINNVNLSDGSQPFSLQTSVNAGSSFSSGASDYTGQESIMAGTTAVLSAGAGAAVSLFGVSATITTRGFVTADIDPGSASMPASFMVTAKYNNNTGDLRRRDATAIRNSLARIDAIRIFPGAGTVNDGAYTLMGIY